MPGISKDSSLTEPQETLVHDVIGSAIEVHRRLGPGFLESIYEDALCHELSLEGIEYERQKDITVDYRGIKIEGQRLDLLVEQDVIVELKAVKKINPVHKSQCLSYLQTSPVPVAILMNFHEERLKDSIHRFVS